MSMHYCQQGRVKREVFVVCCKRCARNIPAGVSEFPRTNLIVECGLCGELRRYRTSEVYLDKPDQLCSRKPMGREQVFNSHRRKA